MKTLKKKSSNPSNRKRKLFRNSLRKNRIIYYINYSPRNTSQFLIKNHINYKDSEEEDYFPFDSIFDIFDLQSENSTTDEEIE